VIREWLLDLEACLGCFLIGLYALRWPLLGVMALILGITVGVPQCSH
jgi:hypothetical protein